MATQVESIKWVPKTKFIVDGFRFQHPSCIAYFLTHAHSDHTTGLTSSFSAGPIFCSPITARILRHDMGQLLRPGCLQVLEVDKPTMIYGVEVTPIDANHCPGAVMFLFKVPSSSGGGKAQTILHTGDLRWHAGMAEHPALAGLRQPGQRLDVLMLDTTYCQPKWAFPPQPDAVRLMAQTMLEEAQRTPATLFVVGSYHIGKERAYLGAAHQLGWKVWCTRTKQKLLRLLGLPSEWLELLTDDAEEAQVHVLGMGEQLHEQALADRIAGTRWERVVAIKPTGWSYRPKGGLDVRTAGSVMLLGIPYSEHSSFPELRDCVRALRPRRIVPTVNAPDPGRSRAIVDRFVDLMDLSADRSRLDAYLRPPAGSGGGGNSSSGLHCGSRQQAEEWECGWERRQQQQQQPGMEGCGCGVDQQQHQQQHRQQWEDQEGCMGRANSNGCLLPVCAQQPEQQAERQQGQQDCQRQEEQQQERQQQLQQQYPCWHQRSEIHQLGETQRVCGMGLGPAAQQLGPDTSSRPGLNKACDACGRWQQVQEFSGGGRDVEEGGSGNGSGSGSGSGSRIAGGGSDSVDEVDLEAIDVGEQYRILAAIQSQSRGGKSGGGRGNGGSKTAGHAGGSGSSGGGGRAKKRAPPEAGSSGGMKQGSLKRFFSPVASQSPELG